MPKVLITGGTGMVGTALAKALIDKGHTVMILSRRKNAGADMGPIRFFHWDVDKQIIDANAIKDADYIFHLAGASVADKRWSAKRKDEIRDSRILGSKLLVKTLSENPNQVKAVISASATGWYGGDDKAFRGKKGFTEDAPAATDFLGETCRLWEDSIGPVETLGKRLVKLRTGIVLGNGGGALKEFKKPVKVGVAAVLGNGKQIISWIHIDDLCRLYIYAMESEMQQVYNAVAPGPVSNKELMMHLARKLKGTFFIPLHVPAFLIKLLFGELSTEVLKSVTVSSEKVRNAGFTFLYPSLAVALDKLAIR